MSGNPIDYEDFTKEISIAPGMTRKLDIPAYEHSRYYHYFKSENMPGGSPAFKIKFQLKDYNVKNDPIEKANNINSDNNQNNVKEQININEISKINIIILFVAVLVMSGICVFIREFGIRKSSKNLVILLLFCIFMGENQQITK